jgi:high-affinity Fe2+/Pb2+ permease
MLNYWTSLLAGAAIFALAIPYVTRICHPEQKPLAAYLIFVSVFVTAAVVLYSLLAWLAVKLGLEDALGHTGLAPLFLVVVLLPAIALASWQARKPPWRQRGPPD